jgi:hypothetical protein
MREKLGDDGIAQTRAPAHNEEVAVNLTSVTDLELQVVPDVSGRPVVATLKALRLR